MKNLFIVLTLSLFTTLVYAQTGTIKGNLKDSKTNESIIGGTVLIQGTAQGAATDVEGNFSIPNVKPGNYNLIVSFISYMTDTIPNVTVATGKVTLINTGLTEEATSLQEVVVTAERSKTTEIALISEIKMSQQVLVGVSAQQISRMPDRDAAQIMQRIPGVTINDNRFVMIRGVGERYNNVLINDAIAPSTEIDSRSFSFDLVPSSIIERMLIYKSGAPELPGDFAGGVIKIYTLNDFPENVTTFSIGTGYRAGTTFNKYYHSKGSSTDFLGFDNKFRSLPSSFPSNVNDVSGSKLENAGKSLSNNFGLNSDQFLPELKLGFSLGRKFDIGRTRASVLTAINYSNTSQYMEVERKRYQIFNEEEGKSPILFAFNDDNYSTNVRLGVIHNWKFQFSPKFTVEFKNMFNQLGEHETVVRNGYNYFQRSELFTNYAYRYISRSIYTGQLQGKHIFGEGKSSYTWTLGVNYVNRNEPDYRRFRTYQPAGETTNAVVLPPSANLFDTGRFFSNLVEKGGLNGGAFEHKFGSDQEEKAVVLKAGYYVEYKQRDFSARYFSYLYPGFNDPQEGERLSRLPINEIFSPENISNQNGFRIAEGTNPTDNYNASNLLTAGYVGLTVPVNKFTFSGGVRVEYSDLTLNTDQQDKVSQLDVVKPLPSINISYDLTDKSLVRVAYTRSINRPEFRELAPFLYYDFNLDANIVGNKNLTVADIDNLDLRWEYYPREGEIISIGGFYKKFKNPIESLVNNVADGQQYSFTNADKAENYGVELEVRKSLAGVSGSGFLDNLSLVVNTSYIHSKVDFGNQALVQESKRALQGQAPYVVNLATFYNDSKRGISSSLMYNVVGPRIFLVGTNIFATTYEMPRNVIDFTFNKTIGKNLELKFSATDLLNSKFRYTQDSNRDGKITGVDESIFRFRKGTGVNLGLTVKL